MPDLLFAESGLALLAEDDFDHVSGDRRIEGLLADFVPTRHAMPDEWGCTAGRAGFHLVFIGFRPHGLVELLSGIKGIESFMEYALVVFGESQHVAGVVEEDAVMD